jgi:hypothetical protein
VSSPILVVPWKNSTFVIVPSESAAVALIVMFAGWGNVAPSTGLVMSTVGGAFPAGVLVGVGVGVGVGVLVGVGVGVGVGEGVLPDVTVTTSSGLFVTDSRDFTLTIRFDDAAWSPRLITGRPAATSLWT